MGKARNISKFKKENLFNTWVNFNGVGAVAIRRSVGVSSITDAGTGSYILNFESGYLQDSNYTVVALNRDVNNDTTVVNNTGMMSSDTKNANNLVMRVSYGGTQYDVSEVNVLIVGVRINIQERFKK